MNLDHHKWESEWVQLAALVNQYGDDWTDERQRWLLDGLIDGRFKYRYFLDEKKIWQQDNLPNGFWHGARITWHWSMAICGELVIQGIEVALPKNPAPQVATKPPQAAVDPIRTGAPGRPTALHIVISEAGRRIKDGEVIPHPRGMAKFAKVLSVWWETKRSEYSARSLSTTTIENGIRVLWHKSISPPDEKARKAWK